MERERLPPVLELRARRLRASRGVTVLRDVTLAARAGEVVVVEGANGAGKSTLLAAAAGALPVEGTVGRPPAIGYAPERADVLPRLSSRRWLMGLARTAGLSHRAAVDRVDAVLVRLALDGAADRPMRSLSRGTVQRVLVAQALLGAPGLLVLDEPAGGLDPDGLARVAEEIEKAAANGAAVLVSRHPSAPIPLPPGPLWWVGDGGVQVRTRGDPAPGETSYEVETGDATTRTVIASDLDAMLRAALDAGVGIRRVVPVAVSLTPRPGPADSSSGGATFRRDAASQARGVLWGAAHRARVLLADQRVLAPGLLFFLLLAAVYATDAGPPLPAAAQTALALAPIVTWAGVLSHLAEGRALGRALTVRVGGRAAAHVAAGLACLPFLVAASILAVLVPVVTQRHGVPALALLTGMTTLHFAAGMLGLGLAALLVPPLCDRPATRILLGTVLYAGLLAAARAGPLGPLLAVAVGGTTHAPDIASAAALPIATGVALVAVAALVARRLP